MTLLLLEVNILAVSFINILWVGHQNLLGYSRKNINSGFSKSHKR
jgi:hypothetical protein